MTTILGRIFGRRRAEPSWPPRHDYRKALVPGVRMASRRAGLLLTKTEEDAIIDGWLAQPTREAHRAAIDEWFRSMRERPEYVGIHG